VRGIAKPEPIMRLRLYNIAHGSRFSRMEHRAEFVRPRVASIDLVLDHTQPERYPRWLRAGLLTTPVTINL
jgi:hypothetical protein